MSVQAKICGLSTPETVDAAVEAGAGFVGFVTFPRSPRHVESLDLLKSLGARVPSSVTRVGLFVDADDALIDARLATGAIDMLQLHGAETAERVAELKARTGKPVIKAIKVAAPGDVEQGIAAYADVADRLMFDAAEMQYKCETREKCNERRGERLMFLKDPQTGKHVHKCVRGCPAYMDSYFDGYELKCLPPK